MREHESQCRRESAFRCSPISNRYPNFYKYIISRGFHNELSIPYPGDTVDYTLSFAKSYDGEFSCGKPGNIAGLDHLFSHTYLRDIPYLEKVEIPITFAETELYWEYKNGLVIYVLLLYRQYLTVL